MKVAIFTTSIDKKDGGPSRSVPILAKGLSSIGVNTTLITFESDNMNLHLLEGSDVNIKILKRDVSYSELENILIRDEYNIIHMQNLWDPMYHKVARIARKNYIPYIMTPRGCLEPWSLKQKSLKKKVAMLLYQKKDLQKASCILATSQMEFKNIRSLGIVAPIAVIPNGIDISEYNCRKDMSFVKKQICFISRIHPKKGIEILIEAWNNIYEQYKEWNIVIAGNGEESYINSLKQLIVEKNLSDCITIIPPVFGKDKYDLYCQSALFVLPTFSENFGMVLAEAMSCGVPVITTTGTPWSELNELGIGWCIDLSKDNIAHTLSLAMDKGIDWLFNVGQMCSQYISDNYYYKGVAIKNLNLYRWVLGQIGKPQFVNI